MNLDNDDAQLARAITLGLAVVWTAPHHMSLRQTVEIAALMADYIETGAKPASC